MIASRKFSKSKGGHFSVVASEPTSNTKWLSSVVTVTLIPLEMWASAQRNGRPAEYRRRPLFNAAKFG